MDQAPDQNSIRFFSVGVLSALVSTFSADIAISSAGWPDPPRLTQLPANFERKEQVHHLIQTGPRWHRQFLYYFLVLPNRILSKFHHSMQYDSCSEYRHPMKFPVVGWFHGLISGVTKDISPKKHPKTALMWQQWVAMSPTRRNVWRRWVRQASWFMFFFCVYKAVGRTVGSCKK